MKFASALLTASGLSRVTFTNLANRVRRKEAVLKSYTKSYTNSHISLIFNELFCNTAELAEGKLGMVRVMVRNGI